jgi:sugar/nucleoside kinase (ribokinase family)
MNQDGYKTIHCIGAALVDILMKPIRKYPKPHIRTNIFVEEMSFSPGGGATNCALSLSKMGAETTLFSKVGSDHHADYIQNELNEAGVNCMHSLVRSKDHRTSTVFVGVDQDGERTFISYHGTLSDFKLSDFDEKHLLSAEVLIYPDLFNIPNFDNLDLVDLLRKAQQQGTLTILDETWGILGFQKELFERTVPYLDYIMPSMDDLKHMYPGDNPEEVASHLISIGAKNVIIKLGADGVLFANSNQKFNVTALTKPIDVVDCTGAGDNFNAGFVFALSRNLSLENSIEFANEVAGIAIRHMGASLEREQLQQLIHQSNCFN